MNRKAAEIRLRYLYRDLVLRGTINLPPDAARKIIGPDRAYHLYGRSGSPDERKKREVTVHILKCRDHEEWRLSGAASDCSVDDGHPRFDRDDGTADGRGPVHERRIQRG